MYKINLEGQRPAFANSIQREDDQISHTECKIFDGEENSSHPSNFSKVLQEKSHPEDKQTILENPESSSAKQIETDSQEIDDPQIFHKNVKKNGVASWHFSNAMEESSPAKNKVVVKEQRKKENFEHGILFNSVQNLDGMISKKNLLLGMDSKKGEKNFFVNLQLEEDQSKEKIINSRSKKTINSSPIFKNSALQTLSQDLLLTKEINDSTKPAAKENSVGQHPLRTAFLTQQSSLLPGAKSGTDTSEKNFRSEKKQSLTTLTQGMQIDSNLAKVDFSGELLAAMDKESVVLNQVVFQISKAPIPLELANSTQFVVKLYPQELGDMVAELQKTEDGISLRLFVESSAVKEMLESNMQSFEEQLAKSEIPFSQIDVELRDFGQNFSKNKHLSDANIWDALTYNQSADESNSSRNTKFDSKIWQNRFFTSWQQGDTILEIFA